MADAPTDITLHQKSKVLEVEYADGAVYKLPLEYLRVYSPSAEVRGHGGPMQLVTGKRDVGVDKSVARQDDEVVVFSIVTEAFGPEASEQVIMTDALPEVGSEWFLGGADSEACVLEARNLTCDFGAMDAGEGRSVTATGYIEGMCGEVPNTAKVSSLKDTDSSNDESTAVAQLEPCETEPEPADVEAQKSVTDLNEETVEFTLSVVNHGPGVAFGDGVYLKDTLPDTGAQWFLGGPDSEACSFGTFEHSHDGETEEHGSEDPNQLVCNWAEIPAGESRTVTVTGYIIGMCGELPNTATVWAENDSTFDNNEATAVAQLPPCADVEAGKEASQDSQAVVFTLSATSVGQEAVTNVSMLDELPDINRTWFLGGADSDACTLESRVLKCAFGDLAPGEQRVVEVKAYTDRMECGEDIQNTVFVNGDNDGNPDNDEASAFIDAPECGEPEPEPPADGNETAEA